MSARALSLVRSCSPYLSSPSPFSSVTDLAVRGRLLGARSRPYETQEPLTFPKPVVYTTHASYASYYWRIESDGISELGHDVSPSPGLDVRISIARTSRNDLPDCRGINGTLFLKML